MLFTNLITILATSTLLISASPIPGAQPPTPSSNCDAIRCMTNYEPVCGSDGITYSNACFLTIASCKNVSVKTMHAGECVKSTPEPKPSNCDAMRCMTNYEPVCGSDGITYSNACFLTIASCKTPSIKSLHAGECVKATPEPKPSNCDAMRCMTNYDPICGSDGITYSNACFLTIASCKNVSVKTMHAGECVKPATEPKPSNCDAMRCMTNYEPVCGSDGITYSNACFLTIASCKTPSIKSLHAGECVKATPEPKPSNCDAMRCMTNFDPICGSDGITYSNACFLTIASCKTPSIKSLHAGKCAPPASNCDAMRCTTEVKQVCGSDGKTYSNACFLTIAQCKNEKIKMARVGKC
ncbi:hypothetical protein BC829DRAFT_395271 [Chytridium lagenaria]|nr:hypothetical protein BC829DRAFT_395271 [Chytridium lagenaria]